LTRTPVLQLKPIFADRTKRVEMEQLLNQGAVTRASTSTRTLTEEQILQKLGSHKVATQTESQKSHTERKGGILVASEHQQFSNLSKVRMS
jgi:hypothetical protein